MDDAPKIVNGKVHSVYEAQFQAGKAAVVNFTLYI